MAPTAVPLGLADAGGTSLQSLGGNDDTEHPDDLLNCLLNSPQLRARVRRRARRQCDHIRHAERCATGRPDLPAGGLLVRGPRRCSPKERAKLYLVSMPRGGRCLEDGIQGGEGEARLYDFCLVGLCGWRVVRVVSSRCVRGACPGLSCVRDFGESARVGAMLVENHAKVLGRRHTSLSKCCVC